MSRHLTIATYHYVRDVERTPFPGIHALPVTAFIRQIERMERDYTIVDLSAVLRAVDAGTSLPDNALLLTFDDGYSDHYSTVFPILAERGHTGLFFVPTMPLAEGRVLDVNKIQFILAAGADMSDIMKRLRALIESHRGAHDIVPFEVYRARFGGASRRDDTETAFVKRMLQKGLPAPLRTALITELFERYVTRNEGDFAAELYANASQLHEMRAHGMHIGCHGHAHRWLDELSEVEQRDDIERALAELRREDLIGARWTMCYPHGGVDDRVMATLRALGCSLAFTVVPARADLDGDRLRLPRFDTNDLSLNTATTDLVAKQSMIM